ncbi:pyridoxamine 5'-phosphate oxidase [Diutina catenulata]
MFKRLSPLAQFTRQMSRADTPIIFAPKTYQYTKGHLSESEVIRDPVEQFHQWFEQARSSLPEKSDIIPEATTFSTARLPSGRVSSRVVLFKELDHHGFIVYSNWDTSKKSQDYESNKWASLTFFWPHQQRQVRVEGLMEKVNRATSERYFATRPRASKIGAWTSPQSSVIESREVLEEREAKYEAEFKDVEEVPCPEYWGGMRIVPVEVEFWQGGAARLHDRLSFRRESPESAWEIVRLAP